MKRSLFDDVPATKHPEGQTRELGKGIDSSNGLGLKTVVSQLIPLGSGSPGNAALYTTHGFSCLLDAGIACRTLEQRLKAIEVDPGSLDLILLTHEHQDHARGAERFSKKHGVPVLGSRRALEAMDRSPVHFADWISIVCGVPVQFGSMSIEAFPVPHDAAEPVGFTLTGPGGKVGYATDFGAITGVVQSSLSGCDALMIESNHCSKMLREGPYPRYLKDRVSSERGHLSNDETAELLALVKHSKLKAVVLSHLSENNNRPELALHASAQVLGSLPGASIRVAETRRPTRPVVWETES